VRQRKVYIIDIIPMNTLTVCKILQGIEGKEGKVHPGTDHEGTEGY
jgi:hypothetical protein